jgi:hypothetical protein
MRAVSLVEDELLTHHLAFDPKIFRSAGISVTLHYVYCLKT